MKCRYLFAAAAAAVLLAGCSTTGGSVDAAAPTGVNADTPKESPESTQATTADTPRFGDAFTWDDGLTVKIGQPKKFKPTYGATNGQQPIRFKVTIVNGTESPFDPALFYATMQSGNEEAEQIFDTDSGLDSGPTTQLLPGREVVFDLGFNVKDPGDLVLEVKPDAGFTYDAAVFTNQ